MIETRKIREDEYEELYSHMMRDFQTGGLAPFHSIRRNLEKNIYDGFYFTESTADIGYALITAPKDLRFALINYFAVFPNYRSKGYGSEFLKIIISRYSERILVLETEDPSSADVPCETSKVALRRVKFYERAGFYILPTERAKIFGIDMLIMASGNDKDLNAREIMHSLYMPSFNSEEWLRFIDVI